MHTAPAVDVCSRCGRFVCDGCALSYEENTVCEQCAPRLASLFGGSWLAVASAITGFVSLGCWPLGLAAVVLGIVDLVRAQSKSGPAGGRGLDAIGIVLGVVGLLIGLAVLVRLGEHV